MLRVPIAALMVFLGMPCAFADKPAPSNYVNLNAPGAMDKLRVSNPAHYEKIQTIISGLNDRPSEEVTRWIQASFNAKDVYYSDIFLTTSPPQRDVSFVLDNTRYGGRVTLHRKGARVFPVKRR